MTQAKSESFFSCSPVFCLSFTMASLATNTSWSQSLLYAILFITIIVMGTRLVQLLYDVLSPVLYMGSFSLAVILFACLPFALCHGTQNIVSFVELGLVSFLLGCSWILADMEYTYPSKISASWADTGKAVCVFLVLFVVMATAKILCLNYLTQLFSKKPTAQIGIAFVLSLLLAGFLLTIFQKIELLVYKYLLKKVAGQNHDPS